MDLLTQIRLAASKMTMAGKIDEAHRLWILYYKYKAWGNKRKVMIKEGNEIVAEWNDLLIELKQAEFVLQMEEELG